MKAVPYTRDAVRDIRAMLAQGASAGELLRKLGWDHDFLKRVCKRHEIEFVWVPSAIVVPAVAPVRPLATRAIASTAQKTRPATPEEKRAARAGPRKAARYSQLTFSSSPDLTAAVMSRAKSLGITRSELLFRLVNTIHVREMWGDVLSSLRPADLGGDELRNCISSVASNPKAALKQK